MTDGKHLTGHKQSLGWHSADTADSAIYRSLDGAYKDHEVMLLTIDRSITQFANRRVLRRRRVCPFVGCRLISTLSYRRDQPGLAPGGQYLKGLSIICVIDMSRRYGMSPRTSSESTRFAIVINADADQGIRHPALCSPRQPGLL